MVSKNASAKSAKSMSISSTMVIILVLAIVILILFAIYNATTVYKSKNGNENYKNKNYKKSERFSDKKLFHIIYAYHETCPHCIKFHDTFDLVARTFAQNVTSHDTEISKIERANISEEHMKHVDGFPTVLIYMDNKFKTRAVGNMSSDAFATFLQDALKE